MVRGHADFAAGLLAHRVLWADDLIAAVLAEQHHPLRAVKRVTVLIALLVIWRPDPLLEDELPLMAGLAVASPLENAILRVGKLLIVVEEKLAAQGGDRRWLRRHAQAPASDVDIVNAVVADIAAAKVVPPPPNPRQ